MGGKVMSVVIDNDFKDELSEMYEILVGGENAGYAFKVTASGSQGNICLLYTSRCV